MPSDNPEVDNAEPAIDDKDSSSSSDANVIANEAEEAKVPEPEPENEKVVKKRSFGWLIFLLVLILLLCAAGAGWYFAQEQARSQQGNIGALVEGQLAGLESEISALRSQIGTQSQRQQNVESTVINASTEVEAQLRSLAQRLSEVESTGSGDWELAEAEYLLRIAHQRLVTSQDVDGAIEMMSAADNIFRALAYPELNDARRQLVADITRLGLVQPVDYEGIYFALDALMPAVSELKNLDVERLTGGTLEEPQSWLSGYWSAIVDALSPYIVINSGADSAPQYLLSDEQISLIKSEIQLQIRQAQLALLAGESEVYKSALLGAAASVEDLFGADERSDALVSTLSQYADRSLSNDSLDISGSIREVERVVDLLTRIQLLDTIPGQQ